MNSNDQPWVTIVCAWYNRPEFIGNTINSLLAQEYRNFKIIIVNDGSTDPRVAEILSRYSDPRLTIINQENTGFTRATVRAISQSESPYVAVMGAGDSVSKIKLGKQVRYLEENKKVGAVGTGHNLISAVSGRHLGYVSPIKKMQKKDSNVLKKKVPFTHGTILYRRSIYLESGGYDPFFVVGQDRDLYWRILGIAEMHSLNEALYDKYIFEDGVSFRPDLVVHKGFYSRLARTQDRREIDFYKKNPGLIPDSREIFMPKYIKHTVKRMAAMIVRREFVLAKQWGSLLMRQLSNIFVPYKG